MQRFMVGTVAAALCLVLVGATAAFAGRWPVPGDDVKVVEANTKVIYHEVFRGGELAEVKIKGVGTSDLDVYVYDDKGNLITQSTGPTDEEVVRFRPFRTGEFRIEVQNLGSTANLYGLKTN